MIWDDKEMQACRAITKTGGVSEDVRTTQSGGSRAVRLLVDTVRGAGPHVCSSAHGTEA